MGNDAMSENKGHWINAWVWKPSPGLLWQASTFDPREIVFAATEEEAKSALETVLGPRALGLLRWIHGPEPVPRRPGAPLDKPAVENITAKEREERIATAYRKAVQILHPDKASDGPVDRDAATRALTELYDAAIGR
jgi:hypothetical protein